jgi:hypothetical protein
MKPCMTTVPRRSVRSASRASRASRAALAPSVLLAFAAFASAATASAEVAADVAPPPVVTDEELPVRVVHPVAIRAEVNVLYDGVFGATDGFGGATVAYSFDEYLSVEGTFGWGFGNVGKTGANAIAMGRFALPLDHAGVHALTFAAGPSTFFGGDYGTVWVARGEIAYELRTRAGFSLLLGGGPSLVLADSKVVERHCTGWFCPGGDAARFKAGDVPLQVRVAAGWAF